MGSFLLFPCREALLCFRYPPSTKVSWKGPIQLLQDPNIFRFSSACSHVDTQQPTHSHGDVSFLRCKGKLKHLNPDCSRVSFARGRPKNVRALYSAASRCRLCWETCSLALALALQPLLVTLIVSCFSAVFYLTVNKHQERA